MVHVAVLGYGTVGSGVVEVIDKNQEKISLRAEREVGVKLDDALLITGMLWNTEK